MYRAREEGDIQRCRRRCRWVGRRFRSCCIYIEREGSDGGGEGFGADELQARPWILYNYIGEMMRKYKRFVFGWVCFYVYVRKFLSMDIDFCSNAANDALYK